VIAVAGSVLDGFRFVAVSQYQQDGHWRPNRWQRLRQAWKGAAGLPEFTTEATLDRFITSLRDARQAIWVIPHD
jgi:hypothetical protein